MSRLFHGVDLEVHYGRLMLYTEDPIKRRELALLRAFRNISLKMERQLRTGMIVMDRENRLYTVLDTNGWNIEEKEYWLQRFTSYELTKKTVEEIYPLEWWMEEREHLLNGAEYGPRWFRVMDAILRREKRLAAAR